MSGQPHIPVLVNEAVAALSPQNGGAYIDATFGAGGYTRAILASAQCTVYGLDRDPTAIERAAAWSRGYGGRLRLVQSPFDQLEDVCAAQNIEQLDGVVFDLGVSSMQLDEAERGFSFLRAGPLSMRMDKARPDARDVINNGEAGDLSAIFKAYGEERRAGHIARAIVSARTERAIETTDRLADIVAKAAPARPQDKIHPATRVFQALRIFVNDELGQLARALAAAEKMLAPAGRLVVVTFHSLEDRIVKRFFADRSGASGAPSRHAPATAPKTQTFRRLHAKAQTPQPDEIVANPRARSAKLRAGIRLDSPARDDVDAFAPRALSLSNTLTASLNQWSL